MIEVIQITKIRRAVIASAIAVGLMVSPSRSFANGAVTGATEMTQMLNNGELISLVGQSTEQINR